jgi:alkylation response protein AidB-like acyl-CoA dehydrogenase
MKRNLTTDEHEFFRTAFREFLAKEAVPHIAEWEQAGQVDRTFVERAAANGFIGFEAPVEYGGLGISDFRYNAVMAEEVVASGISGDTFTMTNDIFLPYLLDLGTPEQRERWLPQLVAGNLVPALAMTEPGAGSDLSAIRTTATLEGDTYVLNGSKTFITNGASCDLVVVLARTGEKDGRGMSLIAVERGTPGFTSGAPLHKVGRRGQDTAELFFDECRVPSANLIGSAGRGLAATLGNLARERLSLATLAVAAVERAVALAQEHVTTRRAFGGRLIDLQAVRIAIAEMHTEATVARVYVDRCVQALVDGTLTAEEAAGAKYWTTDLQCSIIDRSLQLFGGYGYMEEYPIARMWRDARVQRIYGGANEVMKELVGRELAR